MKSYHYPRTNGLIQEKVLGMFAELLAYWASSHLSKVIMWSRSIIQHITENISLNYACIKR